MGIAIERLEKVKRSGNGMVIARCPACAAVGQDRQGNHLKVYPDGRFGCVLFPGKGGRMHRQEIWQAAGDRDGKWPPLKISYTVKVR